MFPSGLPESAPLLSGQGLDEVLSEKKFLKKYVKK
jgi:hypothetical protein